MSRLTVSRRRMLALLGLGAAAATPVFRSGRLHASDRTLDRPRFVSVYHPNGWRASPRDLNPELRFADDLFFPGGQRGTDYDLVDYPGHWPEVLEPLKALRQQLLILEGLRYAELRRADSHVRGTSLFLTGARPPDDATVDASAGPSLDHHLGARSDTPFKTLNLAAMFAPADQGVLSHRGANLPNRPDSDPWEVFTRLFADLVQGGQSDQAVIELARLRARRASILDHNARELTAVRPWVPQVDRERLDAHLDAIRTVEKGFLTPGTQPSYCGIPDVGAPFPLEHDNLPRVVKLHLDTIVAALACNLTTVATLMFGFETTSFVPVFLGADTDVHVMSHWFPGDARQPVYTKTLRWIAQQVAYLVNRLDAIPEADGKSLLQHSLVLWGSENSDGASHTVNDVPFILAGGAGGNVTPGRFVSYPKSRYHNDLLISLSRALGRPAQTFGEPELCTGPLDRLKA